MSPQKSETLMLWKNRWLIVLILLLALALRTYRLMELPPGLTHDEANHGVEAMGVLAGDWYFYFPRNYGSEPLYSYLVALTMAGGGENLLALRLVNVWFGVLVIAAAYRLTLDLFRDMGNGRHRIVAVGAAAVMTLTFWPLASSREALRAGVLPFLTTMAVLIFWRLVQDSAQNRQLRMNDAPLSGSEFHVRRISLYVFAFALFIALMLHTYLAARVAWLIFPLCLGYLFLWHRAWFWRSWRPVLGGILLAGLLVIPMFVYLQTNPYAETRLEMLDGTLQALREGDVLPLLRNIGRGLAAFIVPGFGDQFLAYNIPGRPVFDGLMGLFGLIGLALCLGRWRQPAYALILLWLMVGIAPSLVTGPTANTTRNLAALTPLMLLPALGLVWVGEKVGSEPVMAGGKRPGGGKRGGYKKVFFWGVVLVISGFITGRDYFERWGENPEVRAAYQHTLVQAVAQVNETAAATQPLVFSTVYPGPAHDPSIAQVLLADKEQPTRWVDARLGLIFPGDAAATLIVPSSTPLHPAFAPYVQYQQQFDLRPDDLDPYFSVYALRPGTRPRLAEAVNFQGAIALTGVAWSHNPAQPGDVVELMSWWQVLDPIRVGPLVPPAFTTDIVFFTQILRPDNSILGQQDRLDVPSGGWQMGDIVVQIHQLALPTDAAAGDYTVIVGLYDRTSLQRTPVINPSGDPIDDKAMVTSLTIR
ncbi:MAG: hypothetical protein V9G20_28330 [Candidatus Promineifilaceae bacterium]